MYKRQVLVIGCGAIGIGAIAVSARKGATVIVALLALNVTGIPFLGLMGTAGAVCVLIAVLIAITLTPALLGKLGMRVLNKRRRAHIRKLHGTGPEGSATGGVGVVTGQVRAAHAAPLKAMPTWRAIVTVFAGVAVLLTIAIPALSMRVGLPDGSSEPEESASYQAFTITEEQFGAGTTGPLLVTATLPEGLDDAGVLDKQVLVAEKLASLDDVTAVAPIWVSDNKSLTAFQVIAAEGPNSVSTEELVGELRALPEIEDGITLGAFRQGINFILVLEFCCFREHLIGILHPVVFDQELQIHFLLFSDIHHQGVGTFKLVQQGGVNVEVAVFVCSKILKEFAAKRCLGCHLPV